MTLNIILIIVGFIILVKGADLFVDGISSTALNLKVAKIIISLTIVAFGTSAPELAISIQGMMNDSGSVVLANVIGSTIVNTMLVVGVAAIIKPLKPSAGMRNAIMDASPRTTKYLPPETSSQGRNSQSRQ